MFRIWAAWVFGWIRVAVDVTLNLSNSFADSQTHHFIHYALKLSLVADRTVATGFL